MQHKMQLLLYFQTDHPIHITYSYVIFENIII